MAKMNHPVKDSWFLEVSGHAKGVVFSYGTQIFEHLDYRSIRITNAGAAERGGIGG